MHISKYINYLIKILVLLFTLPDDKYELCRNTKFLFVRFADENKGMPRCLYAVLNVEIIVKVVR